LDTFSTTSSKLATRAEKTVAINLADVSDLVADGRDLADGGLKPPLCARRTAQTVTNILPNVPLEKQGRDLTR
jgi:hypothetical protein